MTGARGIACVTLLGVVGCSSPGGAGRQWHPGPPRVTVSLDPAADSMIRVMVVRLVRAPDVRFVATPTLQLDLQTAVWAPTASRVVRVRPTGGVAAGDTLVVLALGGTGAPLVALALHDGRWRPQSAAGVWARFRTLLGVVARRGSWTATGEVSDLEDTRMHEGDAARALRGTRSIPGRVRRVRRASYQPPYRAEVTAQFDSGADLVGHADHVAIIIAPAHTMDSLPSVPTSAVAALPAGSLVFLQLEPGLYRVEWVEVLSRSGNEVILREQLPLGSRVVVSAVDALVAAVRDSIANRQW